MNNTCSLDQTQKTGDLSVDLILRQYKLDKVAKFMEIKPSNPKLKQSEMAKLLELSSSRIQRYRRGMNMLSPCSIPPSSKTNQRKQKTPNTNFDDVEMTSDDLKMISNDLAKLETNTEASVKRKSNSRNKNNLKVGSVHENIEMNDKYLE